MTPLSEVLLEKAQECLAGAVSELAAGRYNNAANRAYYACFQAAVAALDIQSVRPQSGRNQWGHDFVQAQFAGLPIRRRRLYPPELRDTLSKAYSLRQQGDYQSVHVTHIQATRIVSRARSFVNQVAEREDIGHEPG